MLNNPSMCDTILFFASSLYVANDIRDAANSLPSLIHRRNSTALTVMSLMSQGDVSKRYMR